MLAASSSWCCAVSSTIASCSISNRSFSSNSLRLRPNSSCNRAACSSSVARRCSASWIAFASCSLRSCARVSSSFSRSVNDLSCVSICSVSDARVACSCSALACTCSVRDRSSAPTCSVSVRSRSKYFFGLETSSCRRPANSLRVRAACRHLHIKQ